MLSIPSCGGGRICPPPHMFCYIYKLQQHSEFQPHFAAGDVLVGIAAGIQPDQREPRPAIECDRARVARLRFEHERAPPSPFRLRSSRTQSSVIRIRLFHSSGQISITAAGVSPSMTAYARAPAKWSAYRRSGLPYASGVNASGAGRGRFSSEISAPLSVAVTLTA